MSWSTFVLKARVPSAYDSRIPGVSWLQFHFRKRSFSLSITIIFGLNSISMISDVDLSSELHICSHLSGKDFT